MTARGVDFLEIWISDNVTADQSDAGLLGARLIAEASVAGFTLADMGLSEETVEDYIREAIVHVAEPGRRGD